MHIFKSMIFFWLEIDQTAKKHPLSVSIKIHPYNSLCT